MSSRVSGLPRPWAELRWAQLSLGIEGRPGVAGAEVGLEQGLRIPEQLSASGVV